MIFFFAASRRVRLFCFYHLLFKIIINFKKNTKNVKNIWWFKIKVLYLYYKNNKKNNMKKEQIIFSEISDLNTTLSHSSSLGSYVSDSSKMVSEYLFKKIIKSIPENSLAFQILTSTDHYSEEQLWVITFELLKNESYCNEIMEEFYERNSREFTKKIIKKDRQTLKLQKKENQKENKQKDEKAFDTNVGSDSNLKYRDWDILEDLPEGWIIDKYCGSPLYGFVFCTNGKSILNGGKRALVRAFVNIN